MPAKAKVFEPKTCVFCEKLFNKRYNESAGDFLLRKFCTHQCFSLYNTKEKHWYYSGGVKTRPDGYVRDSRTDKYIHRMVMEKFLGRELKHYEHVHHINGNTSDTRIENLAVMLNKEHSKLTSSTIARNNGRFVCQK